MTKAEKLVAQADNLLVEASRSMTRSARAKLAKYYVRDAQSLLIDALFLLSKGKRY